MKRGGGFSGRGNISPARMASSCDAMLLGCPFGKRSCRAVEPIGDTLPSGGAGGGVGGTGLDEYCPSMLKSVTLCGLHAEEAGLERDDGARVEPPSSSAVASESSPERRESRRRTDRIFVTRPPPRGGAPCGRGWNCVDAGMPNRPGERAGPRCHGGLRPRGVTGFGEFRASASAAAAAAAAACCCATKIRRRRRARTPRARACSIASCSMRIPPIFFCIPSRDRSMRRRSKRLQNFCRNFQPRNRA